MQMELTCPACNSSLCIDGQCRGQTMTCPACQAAFSIPQHVLGPGTVLGGFRLERKIGAGGMGEVYLARQLSIDRTVAVKILGPHLTGDADAVARFLQEVRSLGQLDHPHIVSAIDAGEDSGIKFYAMTYVDGETLDALLKREKALPEDTALRITSEVADALRFAWEENRILHRDIKPANIMLDRHGQTRLMDLGLAKSLLTDAGLTMTDMAMGTPHYMSPEQGQAAPDLDFRSDMYALGATLYHMVTGHTPYSGDTPVQVIAQHVLKALPPPRERNPAVSPACAHLIEKMMAKDRNLRYPNWNAVLKEICRVRAGPVAAPRPAGVAARAQPPMPAVVKAPVTTGRLRWAWAAAAVLVAGAIAGAILLTRGHQPVAGPRAAKAQAAVSRGPPAAVTTVVPAKPEPEVAPRAAKATAMFREAVAYADAHLDDWDGSVARFRIARAEAPDGATKALVDERIARIEQRKATAAGALAADLEAKAKNLAVAGKTTEAAALLRDYAGPLAKETATRREAAAAELTSHRAAVQEAAALKTAALEQFHSAVASDILDRDAAGLQRAFQEASANPRLAEQQPSVAMARRQTEARDSIPARLRQSFAAEVGKTLKLDLRGGTETLSVKAVTPTGIKATQEIKSGGARGEIGRDVSWAELSAAECARRLAGAQTPDSAFLLGLLALDDTRLDEARKQFEAAATPLAAALLAEMDRRAGILSETRAKQAFHVLLETAGLPPEETDMEKLVGAAVDKRPSATQAVQINAAVAEFRGKHGGSDVAKHADPLLNALASLRSAAAPDAPPDVKPETAKSVPAKAPAPRPKPAKIKLKPATKQAVEDALAELRTANPDMEFVDAQPVYQVLGDTILLDLKQATNLSDLEPLRGLPLSSFGVACPQLSDLGPLAGMPLRTLSLSAEALRSVEVLRGMKLANLGLTAKTVDADMDVFEDMPLDNVTLWAGVSDAQLLQFSRLRAARSVAKLGLTASVAVRDLSPLRNFVKLWFLGLGKTCTDDMLRTLPKLPHLGCLSLSGSQVTDLTPVTRCVALTQLDFAACPVGDLSPVAKLTQLTRLKCPKCPIRDISPLAALPLETVDLQDTQVADAAPLAKCKKLRELTIPETAANLESLRKLPNLEKINDAPAAEFWRKHYLREKSKL